MPLYCLSLQKALQLTAPLLLLLVKPALPVAGRVAPQEMQAHAVLPGLPLQCTCEYCALMRCTRFKKAARRPLTGADAVADNVLRPKPPDGVAAQRLPGGRIKSPCTAAKTLLDRRPAVLQAEQHGSHAHKTLTPSPARVAKAALLPPSSWAMIPAPSHLVAADVALVAPLREGLLEAVLADSDAVEPAIVVGYHLADHPVLVAHCPAAVVAAVVDAHLQQEVARGSIPSRCS